MKLNQQIKRVELNQQIKRVLANATLYMLAASVCIAQGFYHPGGLHTQGDFDRIKAQIAANHPRVKPAWDKLRTNSYALSTYNPSPQAEIRRGGTGENYASAMRDAAAAYQNALVWHIGGNTANADCAIKILNAWARTCKVVTGDSNFALAAGIYGYEFAQAAELMRDYTGWKKEDLEWYKTWTREVFVAASCRFLALRNGQATNYPCHYWSNWGLCNALHVMIAGIFLDDIATYNWGLQYYKADLKSNWVNYIDPTVAEIVGPGFTEYLGNLVPAVYTDARGPFGRLGQMQETGRDAGHANMAMGLAADICQVAYNQGDDCWAFMDNRLAAGIEYQMAISMGVTSLPWTTYIRRYYSNQTDRMTTFQTGSNDRPIMDRIIGYYEGIKGVTMTYARQVRDRVGVDGGGGHYGGNSGGFDHLGFTTLTCTRDAVSPAQAPVKITPQIVYNSKTYNDQSHVLNIAKGTNIQLVPTLPSDETDTGLWQWETGETERILTIKADHSALYRVTYTGSNGVSSVQMFSINVSGDCLPARVLPTIVVGDVEYSDTTIAVKRYTTLTLKVNPRADGGSVKWSNNSTEKSITLNNITSDREMWCDYTNTGGAKTRITFHITVSVALPYMSIDDGEAQQSNYALLTAGSTLKLWSEQSTLDKGGTTVWYDGAKNLLSSSDVLEITPTVSDTIQMTYTNPSGKTASWGYALDVQSKNTTPNGYFLIGNRETGLYLTNPLDNDILLWAAYDGGDAQRWLIQQQTSQRYKISSKADSRIIYRTGIIRKAIYYASNYDTYNIYELTGYDYVALQRGGNSTATWWSAIQNTISIDVETAQAGFPFFLTFLNFPDAIEDINADNDLSLNIYTEGNRLVVPEGAVVYNVIGVKVHTGFPLPSGIYIVSKGSTTVKVSVR